MTEREQIPMPSAAQKEQAICAVLDAGIDANKKAQNKLPSVREIPFAVLFWGLGDCIALASLLGLVCMVAAAYAEVEQTLLTTVLFLLSPALYAALYFLTRFKESYSGTLEWKQTCRLSFGTVTALRILIFGAGATFLCVPQSMLLWYINGRQLSLLWMLSVSFASLFVYAALLLAVNRLLRGWAAVCTPVLWVGAGVLLQVSKSAADVLVQVPAVVFLLLAAAASAIIFTQLKSLITRPEERGLTYAVR